MDGYDQTTYGDRWAEIYDAWTAGRFPAEVTLAAVDALADLAQGGRALELAIGTGRVALPLSERGIEVHGIDASEGMVAKLRGKPGGADLPVTVGDFADVGVDATFDLVFVVFNSFFALSSQDEQVRCFRNVADRLTPGGSFVIEAFVPDPRRFEGGQTVRAERVGADEVHLSASRHDPVTQTIRSQQIVLTEQGARLHPVHLRYAWPSELDLMASIAGLQLRDRWGDWDRSDFTATSNSHVSVYARRTA